MDRAHARAARRGASGFAAVLGVDPVHVALIESTSRGCAIVLAGLGLAGEDEVITTDQEHFGLTGPLHATGVARRHRRGERGRDPRRRHAAHAAHRDLARALDDRPPTRPAARSRGERRADARRRRAVCGRDPGRRRGLDFYTVSAQKWLCAPDPPGALYVRDPERVRVTAPSYLARRPTSRPARSSPKEGAARFDAGWIATPVLLGLLAALGAHPEWRYERAAEQAARCRELLAPHVEVVTPPGHSTLVSFQAAGRSGGARHGARRARRHRARAAGAQSRARVVRLVDERGRPAAARRRHRRSRLRRGGRARPRSAAAPRRRCGCGRRGRRRAPRRPCRRPRGARRRRTTAASASSAPTSARALRARSGRTSAHAWTKPENSSHAKSAFFSGVSRGSPRCSAWERTVSTTSSG